jgi:hypothetical protein
VWRKPSNTGAPAPSCEVLQHIMCSRIVRWRARFGSNSKAVLCSSRFFTQPVNNIFLGLIYFGMVFEAGRVILFAQLNGKPLQRAHVSAIN